MKRIFLGLLLALIAAPIVLQPAEAGARGYTVRGNPYRVVVINRGGARFYSVPRSPKPITTYRVVRPRYR